MKRFGFWLALGLVLSAAAFGANRLVLSLKQQELTHGDVPTAPVVEAPFLRVAEANGYLKPVDSTPITSPRGQRRPRVIAWMADDGAKVAKGDVLLRFDDAEELLRVKSNQADRTKAERALEKERVNAASKVNDRDLTATVTKEELARTKELGVKDQRFFPRNEVIESQLDEKLYDNRLKHAADAKVMEQKVSGRQLEVLGVDRRKAMEQAEDAKKSLASLEVRAAGAGIFVVDRYGDRILRKGDMVWPGMRIAEVATSDRMEAEVFVLEADAGGLAVGKDAELVVESQPGITYKAKVSSVEPFPKPLHPDVPTQYFTARISAEGLPAGLKPGQSVKVRIFLENRNKAVVVPRQAVFERDGENVVWKEVGNNKFERVPVKLGPGTVGRLVLEQGPPVGTRLALRDPEKLPAGQGGRDGKASATSGLAPMPGAKAAPP
ncbi:MAG: HlyD family efflux transporter periplasmic adaptor subunit [Deltaproteobacteria bacterium]|nr:HlyD family efflux transporter periplasmic adaptor subunit [Deltaproteobacteria bacterium]